MESVLGEFFAGEFSSQIQMQYKKPVHLLSKRFFFKLLRNLRFEKAFRLAVELSSKELFMVSIIKMQYIHKLLHILYTAISDIKWLFT